MEMGSLAPAAHDKEGTVKSHSTVDINKPMELLTKSKLLEEFGFEITIGRRIVRGPPANIAPPARRSVYMESKIPRMKRPALLAQAGGYVTTIKRSRGFNQ
jgi:hypothetical protein